MDSGEHLGRDLPRGQSRETSLEVGEVVHHSDGGHQVEGAAEIIGEHIAEDPSATRTIVRGNSQHVLIDVDADHVRNATMQIDRKEAVTRAASNAVDAPSGSASSTVQWKWML